MTTETTTRTIVTTTKQQSQETATNGVGSCGVTPPPTPQNELSGDSTSQVKLKTTTSEDDASTSRRIVLNTVKEPPIVFLSDFETDNKLNVAKQTTKADASPNEPVTSGEVTVSTLKKGEEVNNQGKKENKKFFE